MKDYILNTSSDSAEAARVRKGVQKGARRFLEKQCVPLQIFASPAESVHPNSLTFG